MPKILQRTVFGNPILRKTAKWLSGTEILSGNTRQFIADMKYTLEKKKYGIGLAAPQVGCGIALSVIDIKPTPTRPDCEPFEMIMINPEIIETFGNRAGMWEGCISCGTGKDTLYATVPRYKKVRLRWLDEHAKQHEEPFDGLRAQVIQHETDHLNGILFVDKVRDTKTYMMRLEYKKRVVKPALKKKRM